MQHYQNKSLLSFLEEEYFEVGEGGRREKGDLSGCIPVILSCCSALDGVCGRWGQGCGSSLQLNTSHGGAEIVACALVTLEAAQGRRKRP